MDKRFYDWECDPNDLRNYYVYQYEHIDEYAFMINPETLFEAKPLLRECLTVVKNLFTNAGWEGDGDISMIWLPPFIAHSAYSNGIMVWHVKQSNNGTSFIASPISLDFLEPLYKS